LTFAVVGGGPTGVELAGQIAEIARDTLRRDFRSIDPRAARILLVEGADRLLGRFPEQSSARAARALERLGVTPVLDRPVVDVDQEAVTLRCGDGTAQRIPARTVVWAAGVRASGLAETLGRATGAGVDPAGRVSVAPDLTLPGHPEVFALGDMIRVDGAEPLPGVAPVAMQQGRYAAKAIRARLKDREPRPFRYLDKGNVATIGRMKAVADIRGLRLSGTLAWLIWLFVHLFYLAGLQNRILVLIRWSASFVTRGRGARLITGDSHQAAAPAQGPPAPVPLRAA
jgi:NADH dehydrogenase